MTINIPQHVFDKYNEGIDYTIEAFGVTCKLVSINKSEEIVYIPNNNVPERNSVNAHRNRSNSDYERQNKIIKETEVYTDIKLKVYWDMKQWINIAGNIEIPNGSIQTIGFLSDIPKILKAKALIVHEDIKDYKEIRFQRFGEYTPMGFKQDRYFSCLWSRV
jgi:hypothetical protein